MIMESSHSPCDHAYGTQGGFYTLPAGGGAAAPYLLDDYVSMPDWQTVPADLTFSIDDGHKHPLKGLKVELLTAAGTVVEDEPTNIGGDYLFEDVPAGEYKIRITLVDHTGAAFDIRHAETYEEPVWAEYHHTQDDSNLAQYQSISFEDSPEFVTSNAPLNDLDKLDDMANVYFNLYQFVGWVKTNLMPATGQMVKVYLFATTVPGTSNPLPAAGSYDTGNASIVFSRAHSDYSFRDDPVNDPSSGE